MKTKKQELLELSYEHTKSWLFPILAIVVSMAIALPNTQNKETKIIEAIFLLIAIYVF